MNAKTTYMGDLQIRRAHARVEPLEEGSTKYRDRIRHGKTERDHASKAWGKRFVNRDKRNVWLTDSNKNQGSYQASRNPTPDWPIGQPTPNDK